MKIASQSGSAAVAKPLQLTPGQFVKGVIVTLFLFPLFIGLGMTLQEGESMFSGYPLFFVFGAIAGLFIGTPLGILLNFVVGPSPLRWAHVLSFGVLGWLTSAMFIAVTLHDLSGMGWYGAATAIAAAIGRAAVLPRAAAGGQEVAPKVQ